MLVSTDVAETLENCAQDFELGWYPNYSGRAMFGNECIGVYGTLHNLVSFVMEVSRLAEEVSDSDWDHDMGLCAVAAHMQAGTTRVDSLGVDTIWYWPGIGVK